jgi:hypothetical protein
MSWPLVQMNPTDCGASSCVMEKPREWGGRGPQWGLLRHTKKENSTYKKSICSKCTLCFQWRQQAGRSPRRTVAAHPLTSAAKQNSQLPRTQQCTHILQVSACACVSNAPLAFTPSLCSKGHLSNSLHSDTEVLNDIPNYRHATHNDVSVNDGPHKRRRSHIIIQYYNTYHCVTIAYSIQYSNMLYRFVA